MKKAFLLLVAMTTMLLGLQAQTQLQIKTYDACDANLNSQVDVSDAVYVANHVVNNSASQNVVTAAQLGAVLQRLQQELSDVKTRLNYVMDRTGANNPFGADGNAVNLNGHQCVDLGVVVNGKSVCWASTNIGAKLPADYGQYFAWGETVGYAGDAADAHWFDGDHYTKKTSYGDADHKTILSPEDDAATVNWGGDWRMPTKEEFDALCQQCDWVWTTMQNSDGKTIKGYKVSNKDDSSKFIFLPAADCRMQYYPVAMGGLYWSASLITSNSDFAYDLFFYEGNSFSGDFNRVYGLTIRAVVSQ